MWRSPNLTLTPVICSLPFYKKVIYKKPLTVTGPISLKLRLMWYWNLGEIFCFKLIKSVSLNIVLQSSTVNCLCVFIFTDQIRSSTLVTKTIPYLQSRSVTKTRTYLQATSVALLWSQRQYPICRPDRSKKLDRIYKPDS